MTRPIFEPSTSRTEAKLGFGSNQLFRRPAPHAGTTPTALRGVRDYGTGLVVASASETPVTFTDWENEDSTVFAETLSGGNLQKVGFLQQGIYTVTITILWEIGFDGITEVCWLDDSTTTGNWPFGQTGNMGQFGSGRAQDSFEYPLTLSITKKFPLYGVTTGDVSGGTYGQIFAKVIQRSGSNKDLTTVTMDIFYWGNSLTAI